MLTLTYDRAQLFNFIGFHGCTLLLVINLCLIVLIERHLLAKHCAFNQWDSMHLVCVMTKSFQFCCIHSSSNLPSPPVALHWKEHPQHETATFTLYSRDVVRLVVSCLFPPDCFGLQMKTFFFFFFHFSLHHFSALLSESCWFFQQCRLSVLWHVAQQVLLCLLSFKMCHLSKLCSSVSGPWIIFHLSDRGPHCTVV